MKKRRYIVAMTAALLVTSGFFLPVWAEDSDGQIYYKSLPFLAWEVLSEKSAAQEGILYEKTGTVLDDIQVHSYDSQANYMKKMYEACVDGSEYAMEAGAIYEAQRNLKIREEGLSAEPTEFFITGKDAGTIRSEMEDFLGISESADPQQWIQMSVPTSINTSFKAYMDYKTITSKSSKQYQLQQQAYTENGFRKIDGYYLVAMGSYYGSCGDKFKVTFDTGNSVYVMMGDVKADQHTDSLKMYRPMSPGYGNVVEFIIDSRTIDSTAKKMGDVSHAAAELSGNVVQIEKMV